MTWDDIDAGAQTTTSATTTPATPDGLGPAARQPPASGPRGWRLWGSAGDRWCRGGGCGQPGSILERCAGGDGGPVERRDDRADAGAPGPGRPALPGQGQQWLGRLRRVRRLVRLGWPDG